MTTSLEKLPVPPVSEVLGYLTPGATFLAIAYVSEAYVAHSGRQFHTPLHATVALLGMAVAPDTWVVQFLLLVAIGLSCYIVGHVIDLIAKLLIDRTLVFKGYGYPYQSLLELPSEKQRDEKDRIHERCRCAVLAQKPDLSGDALSVAIDALIEKQPRWAELSGAFYRGFLFWLALYLSIRWLGLVRASYDPAGSRNFVWRTANVLAIWCVLHIAFKTFCGGWIRATVRRVHDSVASSRPEYLRRFFLRIYRLLCVGGYEAAAVPIGKILNTRRSFDADFMAIYKERFRRCFGFNPETAESNNYWFPLMYVIAHSAESTSLLSRYHQLYRFSRNLSVSLTLGFSYCVIWYHLNTVNAGSANAWPPNRFLLVLPLVLLTALLFLLHYYYLYVCYYSKFLFRTFVFLSDGRAPAGASVHPLSRESLPAAEQPT